ncbi:MAG TPA: RDD family protein [Alphaproteobacteria bacterium]
MSQSSLSWGATSDVYLEPEPVRLRGVLWRRSFGYLVDGCIIAVMSWIVLLFLAPVWPVVFTLIPLAYHTLLIGGPRSATLGQRLFDVEVRRVDGGRPTHLQAFVQTVIFYVTAGMTSGLILIVPLFNRRRRALHDVLAGTLTLRRSAGPEFLLPHSSPGARA